jgi:hypothetical protein
VREGLTLAEEAEIRALKKRNRLLEQENEVLIDPSERAGGNSHPLAPDVLRVCNGPTGTSPGTGQKRGRHPKEKNWLRQTTTTSISSSEVQLTISEPRRWIL